MDTRILVEADVDQGARLIRELDEAGLVVRSALWLYLEESQEWRLMIATPFVDAHGPKKAYEKVQEVLKLLDAKGEPLDIALWQITLVSPNDSLIKRLSQGVRVEGIARMRLSRNSFGGQYVDDALLYRST